MAPITILFIPHMNPGHKPRSGTNCEKWTDSESYLLRPGIPPMWLRSSSAASSGLGPMAAYRDDYGLRRVASRLRPHAVLSPLNRERSPHFPWPVPPPQIAYAAVLLYELGRHHSGPTTYLSFAREESALEAAVRLLPFIMVTITCIMLNGGLMPVFG